MIYVITFHGRMFVATEDNLQRVKAYLLKYCDQDDMRIQGPMDFVEINHLGLDYDPQDF